MAGSSPRNDLKENIAEMYYFCLAWDGWLVNGYAAAREREQVIYTQASRQSPARKLDVL
jgi:hypothetical protein